MSRTFRNFGHAYAKGSRNYEEAASRHHAGIHPGDWWSHLKPGYDFRKAHVMHGRDGAISFDIGYAFADGPHCYNSWNEVWTMRRKRRAKYMTGRLRRIRDKKIIRSGLDDRGDD